MQPYLLVDGLRVETTRCDGERLWFELRLPADEIRLVSGSARPAELLGTTDDMRRLGVCLRGLRWRQGGLAVDVSAGQPGFIDGFYHVEWDDDRGKVAFRWTNGDAGLPPAVVPQWHGRAGLEVVLSFWEGSLLTPGLPRDAASVMGAFESLGENCDLAFAQRHYGVDQPLTLFRWAGTSYERLLAGLENGFAGLGEANTSVRTASEEDLRLETPYLNFHTFDYGAQDAASLAQLLTRGNATLRLLRRKLLRDIAEARRIFVYKTEIPTVGHEEMRRLHRTLRAIGPASLLCVTPKRENEPAGQVVGIGDGLYAGCLERFVIQDNESRRSLEGWLELCSNALELHMKRASV